MRTLRFGLLVFIAFALVGCGAKSEPSASTPSGADFAPASSVLYVTGVTDPSSSQWQKADELLGRFPGREELLASARKDLAKDGLNWERDVKPALGDELNLVLLSFKDPDHNFVGFTKPRDEAKFIKVLESGKPADRLVHRKIEGWTVFADNEKSLDNFVAARAAGGPLANEDAFKAAMEDLPEDTALRGYVPGAPLNALIQKEARRNFDAQTFKSFSDGFGQLRYISFSSSAKDEGLAFQAGYAAAKGAKTGTYDAKLDSTLPAGALAYLSFGDLQQYFDQALSATGKDSQQFNKQLEQFQQALGFDLKDDLLPLFSKEGAIAVYNGERPVPEVLFALRVDDEDKATKLIDRLAAFAGLAHIDVRPLSVHGATGKSFSYPEDNLTIDAVVGAGKVLVSNSRSKIQDALGNGAKLADDSVYEQALEASSAPDETSGFVYANLKLTLPLLFGITGVTADPSATDVLANTKPLQSAILYTKQDGDQVTISGFVTIK